MKNVFEELQRKAEEILSKSPVLYKDYSIREFDQLLHDVRVHHIELELQNEELLFLQKNLEESRNKYATLFNEAPHGYLTLDASGIILLANETFCEMVGTEIQEVTGKSFGEFLGPEDRAVFLARFKAFFKSPAGKNMELTLNPVRGKPFLIRFTGRIERKLTDDGQQTEIHQKLYVIVSDITEQKESESALRMREQELSQIIAEKDRFFSIIAHDLKGPFNTFLGFTELLNDEEVLASHEETRKMAMQLNKTARNLFSLLENLLSWSRLQQGKLIFHPRYFELQEIFSQLLENIQPVAEQKEIQLIVDLHGNERVFADFSMMETVFRNLVSNAVKFSNRGSKVYISSEKMSDKFTAIMVRDSGIGISQENISGLFRIDQKLGTRGTEGETGTGLGLILSKELAERNGSRIEVESTPGQGTRFTVFIPTMDESESKNS